MGDDQDPRTNRTDRARATFLSVFRQTANVSEAARAAAIARRTAYDWRDADPDFAAAWAEAEQEAVDRIEREALRRAVEGWDEPVWHQGQQCGVVRKYSDRMLEILLKGHRPKFSERHVIAGDADNPLTLDVIDPRAALLRGLAPKPAGGGDPQSGGGADA